MLLHGQVVIARVEVDALEHVRRTFEGRVDVAELEVNLLVYVVAWAVVVDARVGLDRAQPFLDVEGGGQWLVVDLDQPDRLLGDELIRRSHRGNRVAYIPDPVGLEGVLVLAHRQNAVLARHRVARDHCDYARQRLRLGGVDTDDAGVRMGRTEHLAVEHSRQV